MENRYVHNSYKILLGLLIGVFTFLLLFMYLNYSCKISYQHQVGGDIQLEKSLRGKMLKNDSLNAKDLDSLFSTWHSIMNVERQQVKLEEKTAEQNLTIWLGVIAAICTILPIVIGLNQSMNIDRQLENQEREFSRKLSKASGEMDAKISAKEAELAKLSVKIEQANCNLSTSRLTSFINVLSVNIKIISELEDLEIHESVTLTCPKLLKVQLDKIEACTQSCLDEYRKLSSKENDKVLSDDVKRMIMDCSLDYFVMLNNLLKKFEARFSGKILYDAQDLMDDIWNKVENLLEKRENSDKTDKKDKDVDKTLDEMHLYAGKVSNVFLGAFYDE